MLLTLEIVIKHSSMIFNGCSVLYEMGLKQGSRQAMLIHV